MPASSLLAVLAASEPAQPLTLSKYQAVVRVEIAFNAGQRTPASLYTWTDVSDYVELHEGITIAWGRQDERSTADANQLALTLDNSDGRFTFGKTTGPYGTGVKLDRPIRVILDPVDGPEVEYFRGYVNEWPTEWDGTDAYAKCTITASSRLSRLGLQAKRQSIIEEAILADSPAAYYTLGEPSGATRAYDSSGSAAELLAVVGPSTEAAVVFGSATGPGTDGLTAVQVQGTTDAGGVVAGQYLATVFAGGTTAYTFECFFLLDPGTFTTTGVLIKVKYVGIDVVLGATVGGAIYGQHGATVVSSGSTYLDGRTHHAAITWDGATLTVYVDGVSVGSSGVATALTSPADMLVGNGLTGVLAHVARYTSGLSATQVLAHSTAGLTGFAGETTDARLRRYAAMAGIPAAEVNAEAGSTTVWHIDTTGKQIVELMRVMETTEGGVLFDGRDGTLTMHNRAHRYVLASSYALNMAEGEIEQGYTPKADRTGLLNDITVKNPDGSITAHRSDAASINDYGLVHTDIETASQDVNQPLALASWLLYKYKDPKERVPSLTVDALAQVGKTPNCAAILNTKVGDKITVSNRPNQAATSSVDYFVEGGTTVIGHESLRVTFNLSPSSPEDQVLIIGDATRGVIGTNPIGF